MKQNENEIWFLFTPLRYRSITVESSLKFSVFYSFEFFSLKVYRRPSLNSFNCLNIQIFSNYCTHHERIEKNSIRLMDLYFSSHCLFFHFFSNAKILIFFVDTLILCILSKVLCFLCSQLPPQLILLLYFLVW